jgi:hypothetical protein
VQCQSIQANGFRIPAGVHIISPSVAPAQCLRSFPIRNSVFSMKSMSCVALLSATASTESFQLDIARADGSRPTRAFWLRTFQLRPRRLEPTRPLRQAILPFPLLVPEYASPSQRASSTRLDPSITTKRPTNAFCIRFPGSPCCSNHSREILAPRSAMLLVGPHRSWSLSCQPGI